MPLFISFFTSPLSVKLQAARMASQPDESFRLGGDSFPASTPSGLAAATPSHLQGSLATTRTPSLLFTRSRLLLVLFFMASSPSTMFLKEILIDPAIKGTMNVLRSCVKARVQRVVLTSSSSATRYRDDVQQICPLNESRWSNILRPRGCCTSCAVRIKSGAIRQPEALGISVELKSQAWLCTSLCWLPGLLILK